MGTSEIHTLRNPQAEGIQTFSLSSIPFRLGGGIRGSVWLGSLKASEGSLKVSLQDSTAYVPPPRSCAFAVMAARPPPP
jgi:hypothetical protein